MEYLIPDASLSFDALMEWVNEYFLTQLTFIVPVMLSLLMFRVLWRWLISSKIRSV